MPAADAANNDATAQPLALSLDARFERPVVAAAGADLALMVRIAARTAPVAGQRRAPLDVAFVLDRSGSMSGEKLDLAKEAVDVAVSLLHDEDRVALVTFDNEVEVPQTLTAATGRAKAALRLALHGIDAAATTNLSGGWLAGCQELATAADGDRDRRLRRALLLTDGLANVGITAPAELMHHATQLRLRGVTTTALGVGLDFDEVVLSGMAEAGGGNFRYIGHPRELRAFFEREIGELLRVVGIAPQLEVTLPHGMRATLINAFPTRRNGQIVTVDLRDLAAGDEVTLIFDVHVAPGGAGTVHQPSLRLTWVDPATDRRETREEQTSPLTLAIREEAKEAPVDAEVAEGAARERASRERRRAIELDRAGQFAEARMMFGRAASILSAAPQSLQVQAELRDSLDLAAADATVGLAEDVRKLRLSLDHGRSRGRRDQ